jgi:hypothetical protein
MVFKRRKGGGGTTHWYEISLQITGVCGTHRKTIPRENILHEIAQEINSPKHTERVVQLKIKQFPIGMLPS